MMNWYEPGDSILDLFIPYTLIFQVPIYLKPSSQLPAYQVTRPLVPNIWGTGRWGLTKTLVFAEKNTLRYPWKSSRPNKNYEFPSIFW